MGGELSFSAGALALLKSRKAAIHNPDDQDTDAAPGIKGSYAQKADFTKSKPPIMAEHCDQLSQTTQIGAEKDRIESKDSIAPPPQGKRRD